MIAHRLTTIASADNLLYFKSRSELVAAEKGTPEYDEIFEKLKCIQYAYGDDEKDPHKSGASDATDEEEFEEILEEDGEASDQDAYFTQPNEGDVSKDPNDSLQKDSPLAS